MSFLDMQAEFEKGENIVVKIQDTAGSVNYNRLLEPDHFFQNFKNYLQVRINSTNPQHTQHKHQVQQTIFLQWLLNFTQKRIPILFLFIRNS